MIWSKELAGIAFHSDDPSLRHSSNVSEKINLFFELKQDQFKNKRREAPH